MRGRVDVEPPSPSAMLHRSYIFLGCDFDFEALILPSYFRKRLLLYLYFFPRVGFSGVFSTLSAVSQPGALLQKG
jgi:hypothetical protein